MPAYDYKCKNALYKVPQIKKKNNNKQTPGLKRSLMSHAKACGITKYGNTIILIALET